MKPLVLSPTQQAEAIGNLVAIRQIGLEMLGIFSKFEGKMLTALAMVQSEWSRRSIEYWSFSKLRLMYEHPRSSDFD
jgi:hypothetical protein